MSQAPLANRLNILRLWFPNHPKHRYLPLAQYLHILALGLILYFHRLVTRHAHDCVFLYHFSNIKYHAP